MNAKNAKKESMLRAMFGKKAGDDRLATPGDFRAKEAMVDKAHESAQHVAAAELASPTSDHARGTKVDRAAPEPRQSALDDAAALRAKEARSRSAVNNQQVGAASDVTASNRVQARGTKVGAREELGIPAPARPDALENLPARAPLTRHGRPAVMTPELEEKVCMLLSLGFSRRQAASYLGIGRMVIARAAERDAEFADNLNRAEDLRLVDPLLRIAGESRKNWRAAAWLIEHQQKSPARRKKAKVAKRRAKLVRRK